MSSPIPNIEEARRLIASREGMKAQIVTSPNGDRAKSVRATAGTVANGTNGTNAPPMKSLSLVCAADVQMAPVTFLWSHRMAFGKVVCIEGKMGLGKTTLLVETIASVTTGRALPGQESTQVGDAILISLEDDKADTLVPRLAAAGADLRRVHLFNGYEFGGTTSAGIFNLSEDIERLRRAIEETESIFVGLDPFTAMLGEAINSYKDQDVRRLLAPLAQVAEETRSVIAFDRHLRKSGGAAEDAGGGSGGIGNACRSVLRVDRDPENSERYLLSAVKSNVSRKAPTLGYRIETVWLPGEEPDKPIETSRITWDGESAWTAETLASHAMNAEERPRADEAQNWLRDALKDGQRAAKELFRAAENDGIPKRTLQRAADALNVHRERKGFGEGSTWSICAKDTPFAPSKSMTPIGANGLRSEDKVI